MLVLINSIILLAAVGVALGALFWKHFAKRPRETTRAIIATFIGTIGMVIFLLQVTIITLQQGENLITFIMAWLSGS